MAKIEEENWFIDQPNNDELKKRKKLILRKIPAELNEEGLRNMCERYGEVEHISWPTGTHFAFVTYESVSYAENLLRRFNDDHPYFKINIEFARDRDTVQETPNNDEYHFLDKPAMLPNDNTPMRNVPEMSTRKIRGPFAEPFELINNSLIQIKDYRNRLLLLADPTKEFFWDSNVEAHVEFETNNQKQIVHGRAILKSHPVKPCENSDAPSETKLKSFTFNANLLPSLLACANCARACDKVCKICDEPLCSSECHASRHEISKKEEDEKVSFVCNRIEAEPICQNVKITSIINHRLLFVRPAEYIREIAFIQLMNDIVKCAKDAESLKDPTVGSLVLAKFDYYQRAMILKHIDEKTVAVAFIDFGNIEVCKVSELKILPEQLKKRKRFATKIRLSKINEDLMNEKALCYLYNIMVHDTELVIKTENTKDGVPMSELKTSDKWVNQMINTLNIDDIILPTIKDLSYRIFISQFNEKFVSAVDCKQMSHKEIIILDNSQINVSATLSCILADNFDKFILNDRRLQNICNYLFTNEMCYTPKLDECCVIRNKGRWYRGYCVEVCFDGFVTMQFIDYGNLLMIEINDIRALPDPLLFDSITIEPICYLDQVSLLEGITDEQLIKLQSKYFRQSRHQLKRMEYREKTDDMTNKFKELHAWL